MLVIRSLCEFSSRTIKIHQKMNKHTCDPTWGKQTGDEITTYRNKTPNSKLPSKMDQIFIMTQLRNKQVLVAMKMIFQRSPEVCPGGGGGGRGGFWEL